MDRGDGNDHLGVRSLLALIFFFSGLSSLMYQVVWQRVLTLHYGVGAVTMTLIVSIYMFGLGLGALLGGYFAERVQRKILLYFLIELLIGIFGLISLPFLQFLGEQTAGSSYTLVAFYVFLFLSVPTLLMGATLPLLTKIFNAFVQNFLNSISFLYFINTLGAAFGALVTSYVVISFFGLDTGIYVAVAINFILAVLIYSVNRKEGSVSSHRESQKRPEELVPSKFHPGFAYAIAFVTGFLAIGYEIVWFRVVGVLVKASPYVFSSVLAVYLLGVALGSFLMNRLVSRKNVNRRTLFFGVQFCLGAFVLCVFLGYYYLTLHTPLARLTEVSFEKLVHPLPRVPSLVSLQDFLSDLYHILDIFFWSGLFVLVPTIFMGASFPLISSLALNRPDREGATIGRVYFFNVSGNVAGGFFTGFFLLPLFSSEIVVTAFICIGLAFGFLSWQSPHRWLRPNYRYGAALVLILLALFLMPGPGRLYECIHKNPGQDYTTYLEEDVDGIVITYKKGENLINYINGIKHGWRPLYSYHFQTGEAIFYSKKVEKVLVIGYGNGTISEIALKMPQLKKLTVVEINHALIKNLKKIQFYQEMFADERFHLVIDDGRRFLLQNKEKFDLILIDPLRARTAFSNNLYSDYFFSLLAEHMTDDAVLKVWMDEFKVMPKTIASVFPHVRQYSFFCLASKSPFQINPEMRESLLSRYSPAEKAGWQEYHGSYLGDEIYVREQTKGYPINEEWKPVCEYYLGMAWRKR